MSWSIGDDEARENEDKVFLAKKPSRSFWHASRPALVGFACATRSEGSPARSPTGGSMNARVMKTRVRVPEKLKVTVRLVRRFSS